MKTADPAGAPDEERTERGLDGLMVRYSRWKRRSLEDIAQEPLSTLALRNAYLCACILLDGVILPWIVVVLGGGFSLLLFTLLFIPAVAAETALYRRMKAAARRA